MNPILKIYQQQETVFTLKGISLLLPDLEYNSLRNRLCYAVRTHKLLRLRRGIYAKPNFNRYELANKIYTPSYISLESVLKKEGVIFQEYEHIFLISYLTRTINVGEIKISYRKIKNEVLLNRTGIKEEHNYFIATKERAFLDALFLYNNYHFDNLSSINWHTVWEMVKIYKNKALENRLRNYYQSK